MSLSKVVWQIKADDVCVFVFSTKSARSLHHAAEVDPDAECGDVTEEGGSGGRSGVEDDSHCTLSFHVVEKKRFD